jgi:hypothetical protein
MGVLSVKMMASSDQTWSYEELQQLVLRLIAKNGGGGGIPEAPEDGGLYGREDAAWARVPSVPPLGPQVYAYDDFIQENVWIGGEPEGNYPGLWLGTSQTSNVGSSGAQNGIIQIAPGGALIANMALGNNIWPLKFSNIAKIVTRFVFSITAFPEAGAEIPFGFTHNAANVMDSANNLFGAFINICPGFSGLPDWTTRADLTNPEMLGIVYGVYGGQYPSAFGYKPSGIVTSMPINTWFDAVIAMVPGVSCKFYVAPYGTTPVLDQNCEVGAIVPATNTAGPVVDMICASNNTGNLLIDKAEYAIWTTEGNKQYGSLLNNF